MQLFSKFLINLINFNVYNCIIKDALKYRRNYKKLDILE